MLCNEKWNLMGDIILNDRVYRWELPDLPVSVILQIMTVGCRARIGGGPDDALCLLSVAGFSRPKPCRSPPAIHTFACSSAPDPKEPNPDNF